MFDDMIVVGLISNKKLEPIITELFICGRNLKSSLVFIRQSSSTVSKNIRLNSRHYFIIKTSDKR